MSEKLTLTIKTELEELTRLAAAVEELGEREGWPPDLLFRVNLALEEMGINVMNYGHDEGVHEIEITLTSEPDSLVIQITDDGHPFDPLNDAPSPDLEGSLEDRRVGGLGVHFVRTMMDEMSYKREEGKNHLTLVTRRVE